MLSKTIVTPDGENEFQLRILKEEGVGLLIARSDKSYLILDSLDYWYDLIQTSYPKKKKCKCLNEWFNLQFDYEVRLSEEDIKSVQIITTCTNCGKLSKAMSVDLDYSPTLHFLEKPIQYCENPNIKYKYKELNCYWKKEDLTRFLQYLLQDLKLHAYCYFTKHPENTRHFEEVSFEKAIEVTTINHRYFEFYFSQEVIETSDMIRTDLSSDLTLKDDPWRKNELIELSAPLHMMGYGLLYYIRYCTQYLDKANIADKSADFEETTLQLERWMKTTFVTGRGKNSFDGEEAHKQVMAKLKPKP